MSYFILMMGTLTAMNMGFAYWLSGERQDANKHELVERKHMSVRTNDELSTGYWVENVSPDINE